MVFITAILMLITHLITPGLVSKLVTAEYSSFSLSLPSILIGDDLYAVDFLSVIYLNLVNASSSAAKHKATFSLRAVKPIKPIRQA